MKAVPHPPGSAEHVRKAFERYVGEKVAQLLTFSDGLAFIKRKPFGAFKYFDGLEEPLVRIADSEHIKDVSSYLGTLTLSDFGTPCLRTPMKHGKVIDEYLNNDIGKKAKARWVPIPNGSVIELWQPKHAQQWLTEFSEATKDAMGVSVITRQYPAVWADTLIAYHIGNVVWKAKTTKRVSGQVLGTVHVRDNHITKFEYEDGGAENFKNPPVTVKE